MTGGKCWRGLELASGGSFFSVEAGRWTRAGERRSSEAEQEVRPPPSLFLSRSPLAPLAVMAQAVDFPRVGRNSRAHTVDFRPLPRAASDFPRTRTRFRALPCELDYGVRWRALGVRPTPFVPRRRLIC